MLSSKWQSSEDTPVIQQQDIQGTKDVEYVNNSKLTEIQQNQRSYLYVIPLKGAKSTQLFASCSMDLITNLPPIDGCNSILIVVDRGNTKGAILIPTTKTLMQEEAGQLLLDNLYKRFGLPDKMLSDQGPQFPEKAFCKLLKLVGIKLNLTMAYHPQTNGATERVNQEIKAYFLIYCSVHPTEWKNSLSTLEFTHNNQ
jgi:hypothetical protein